MANVGDIYMVRFVAVAADQTSFNVRHYQVSAKAGTGATDNDIAIAADTLVFTHYKGCLSQNATYKGVLAARITPLPPSTGGSTGAHQGAGTVASDLLPRQVSGVITLKTAFAGRSYRGRAYIPFPGEDDNDANGLPTAGYIVRLALLAVDLNTNLIAGAGGNTNTLFPVVHSKKLGTNNILTGVTANSKWGTQRRRGSYGHANPSPI